MATLSNYLLLVSSVSAQLFVGSSPRESFFDQSEGDTEWAGASTAGAIIGFTVFGVAFLGTVVAIFYDTHKRSLDYDAKIAKALSDMTKLGMDKDMEQINKELQARIAGSKKDEGVDDQLLGEAQKLAPADYQQYM